jgi:Ca-activated chloride channel family protein
MHASSIGLFCAASIVLAGCAGSQAAVVPPPASAKAPAKEAQLAVATPEKSPAPVDGPRKDGPWIGAAPASDFVLRGSPETLLGVWVDVPTGELAAHPKTAVSLVIDTSGSMAGAKIEHARLAARSLLDHLADGDFVSIDTFSDDARALVSPTFLGRDNRGRMTASLTDIGASGGTNLFEGLRLGALHVAGAPSACAARRVVLISDGIASVGPTSPETLGAIAEKGAEHGIQFTAIGVGLDYDERTLNTLAMRSSGRMYHIASPEDMASVLAEESRLFASTRATNAFVEIVPAPGVMLLGVDGARSMRDGSGALHVPLGAMFGGQHREMLVRARVTDPGAAGEHPLASVRLHFQDPSEQGLERVQEVVARYALTDDLQQVASHENERTRSIAAVQEAARTAVDAAQQVNEGRFEDADAKLAQAEARLKDAASRAQDEGERRRVLALAQTMSAARSESRAAAAAPPAAKAAARRASALKMNSDAMDAMGF